MNLKMSALVDPGTRTASEVWQTQEATAKAVSEYNSEGEEEEICILVLTWISSSGRTLHRKDARDLCFDLTPNDP